MARKPKDKPEVDKAADEEVKVEVQPLPAAPAPVEKKIDEPAEERLSEREKANQRRLAARSREAKPSVHILNRSHNATRRVQREERSSQHATAVAAIDKAFGKRTPGLPPVPNPTVSGFAETLKRQNLAEAEKNK